MHAGSASMPVALDLTQLGRASDFKGIVIASSAAHLLLTAQLKDIKVKYLQVVQDTIPRLDELNQLAFLYSSQHTSLDLQACYFWCWLWLCALQFAP